MTANIKQKNVNIDVYSDFLLTIKWNYFITPTTPYKLTLPSARRAMNRLYERVEKITLGNCCFFWAAEPFDTREGYHTHGLLKTDLDYETIIKAWQITSSATKNETWARINIKKYNAKKGAARYCAKYIQKYLADYDFFCNL